MKWLQIKFRENSAWFSPSQRHSRMDKKAAKRKPLFQCLSYRRSGKGIITIPTKDQWHSLLLGRPTNCWHETVGTCQLAALSMLCFITICVLVTPTTLHVRTFSRHAKRRLQYTLVLLGDVQCCQGASAVLSWRKSQTEDQLQSTLFCTLRKHFSSHPQWPKDAEAPRYSLDAQQCGCIPAGSSC